MTANVLRRDGLLPATPKTFGCARCPLVAFGLPNTCSAHVRYTQKYSRQRMSSQAMSDRALAFTSVREGRGAEPEVFVEDVCIR